MHRTQEHSNPVTEATSLGQNKKDESMTENKGCGLDPDISYIKQMSCVALAMFGSRLIHPRVHSFGHAAVA